MFTIRSISTNSKGETTSVMMDISRRVKSGEPNPNTGECYRNLEEAIAEYIELFDNSAPLAYYTAEDEKDGIDLKKMAVPVDRIVGKISLKGPEDCFVTLNSAGIKLYNNGFFNEKTEIIFSYVINGDKEVVKVIGASVFLDSSEVDIKRCIANMPSVGEIIMTEAESET